MLDHSNAETMGHLLNVLCQVGVTFVLANFMLLDVPVDRDVPIIVGRSFMYTCGAIMNTVKGKMTTFDSIVHQQFKMAKVRNVHEESDSDDEEESESTHNYEAESSSRPKRHRETKTVEEAMLGRMYHPNLLWAGCNRDNKRKYNTVLARLLLKQVFVPCVVDWTVLNKMGCAETIEEMLEIKVIEMRGNEEIFSSEAWRRAFDINEPIYTELCHEFFSTFEFNEEVSGEELTTKKIIRFRLGCRVYFMSLLEFARHLGLYKHAQNSGGSSEDQLHFSRSATHTIRSPFMRVLQNMITYGLF
ncbi:hypothetical protein Tco_0836070 [Tanacetum coccineum]